jgi:hypothetical protein
MLDTRVEDNQRTTPEPRKGKKNRPRHWLEYAAVVAASLAALATTAMVFLVAWQAGISRDTERRQLRAYIGITPGDVENFGDRDKQILRIIRKNYGLTPAYDVITGLFHDVIRINGPIPTPISGVQGPSNTPTLFPSMEAPFYWRGTPLSQQQVDLIRNGKEYQLVFWGMVTYTDAFGAKHFTRFCYLYKGPNMTSKDADICFGHNDSD